MSAARIIWTVWCLVWVLIWSLGAAHELAAYHTCQVLYQRLGALAGGIAAGGQCSDDAGGALIGVVFAVLSGLAILLPAGIGSPPRRR